MQTLNCFIIQKVSVVNLFDVSKNFQSATNEWLLQKYVQSQQDPDDEDATYTGDPLAAYQTRQGPPAPSESPGYSPDHRRAESVIE